MFLHSEVLSFVCLVPVSISAISTRFSLTAALSEGSSVDAFTTSEQVKGVPGMGFYL